MFYIIEFCVLGEFLMKEVTIWVIVDLGTEQGRQLVRNAIAYTVSLSQVHTCAQMS